MQGKSPEVEEYLETIYREKEKGKLARTKTLAMELKISPASASEMLQKLAKNGLINYKPYKPISLTKKGEKIGRRITEKHRLIEKFLTLIGIRKNVHEEACVLEHAVSDNVEKALKKQLVEKKVMKLCNIETGECAEIMFIQSGRNAKRRLMEMGLVPKTRITVKRKSENSGPIEINVRGSSLVLGRNIAEKVLVKKSESHEKP